ncbi:MAG: sigma-70 family RNA polymerase sigma factor [Planctomycetes bacterium]|nr:sigma-70 family RNA polymerase sigma factor [Planctomycetota bacterium]
MRGRRLSRGKPECGRLDLASRPQHDRHPEGHDPGVRLAARARSGDRGAFSALWEDHRAVVHAILLSMLPRQEVADAEQEVSLLALRSIEGLSDEARFGAWLATIARNRGRDILRQRRQALQPLAFEPRDDVAGLHETAERAEQAAEVMTALRSLPRAFAETLTMRLVEGLTGPQIAKRTGMTPGSVRVNLHRGMKQLRERLQTKEPK